MKDTHQKWFKEARFGLFIHWGLFSQLAGEWKGKQTPGLGEWIMNDMDIPVEEYRKVAESFNPVEFDADAIVRMAKEKWGMKYLVFTSKHHDGFAMWHSKVSKYNIVDATPFKRDVMKELSDACAKYGLKFCLYYSQAQDWDDPDGFRGRHDNSHKDIDRYIYGKCIPQIREILTGYGEIGSIWFDTPMELTEKQTRDIIDTVKKIQPECIISGRIGNDLGEYMSTGDNCIPANAYLGDWEVPATLNDTWGYSKFDHNWKTPEELIRLLVIINSRGGNYLLNIGPDGMGRVPEKSIEILDRLGEYVMRNSDAIYGTLPVVGNPYMIDYGELTRKPHKIFAHVIYKGKKEVWIPQVQVHVKRIYILGDNRDLEYWQTDNYTGNWSIAVYIPEEYKGKTGYVVCVETEEEDLEFQDII